VKNPRAESETVQSDRRRFGRRTAFKPSRVILGSGSTIAVIVIDQSNHGVGLSLTSEAALPENFDLFIEADDTVTTCKLIWQKGNRAGAEFIRSPRRASQLRRQSLKLRRLQLEELLARQEPKREK